LLIVCNTKDYHSESKEAIHMDSEYFSDNEFEQIAEMFGSIGIPIDFFTYEDNFIQFVLSRKDVLTDILVYNAAQSGTGPGRKSLIPAFCGLHRLTCTGSNAYIVSLCRHKYHVNKLLAQLGIPTPRSWLFKDGWLLNQSPEIGLKVIIKPIYESASIGISDSSVQIYHPRIENLILDQMQRYQQPIIVQEFISGYEVEVPQVRAGEESYCFSPVGISIEDKLQPGNEILNYKRIYFDNYSFYDFKKISNDCALRLQNCAVSVASILGMEGLCRVDFRIKPDQTFYVTDVSTNPHFVAHSSVNFAFRKINLFPTDIARSILSAAIIKEQQNA
jgi:D-alanine-D-alanine ligase